MSRILMDAEQQRCFISQVQVEAPRMPPPTAVGAPHDLTLPCASPLLSLSPEAAAYYEQRHDLAQLSARAACHRVGTPDQSVVIINDPCLLASYVPLPSATGWMLPVEHGLPYWFRIVLRPQAPYADLEYASMSRVPQFISIDPAWAAAFTCYVVLASGGRFAVQHETISMVPDWLAIYAHAYVLANCIA